MVVVTHFPVVPRFWLLQPRAEVCMVFALDALVQTVCASVPDVVIVPAGLVDAAQLHALREALPEHALLLVAAEGPAAAAPAGVVAGFDGVLGADELEQDLARVLAGRGRGVEVAA